LGKELEAITARREHSAVGVVARRGRRHSSTVGSEVLNMPGRGVGCRATRRVSERTMEHHFERTYLAFRSWFLFQVAQRDLVRD